MYLEILGAILVAWVVLGVITVGFYNIVKFVVRRNA